MKAIEPKQDSHCSYCGTRFTEQVKWPRKCFHCYNESYKNPIPIVVTMIPVVLGFGPVGLLIQKRNIDPQKGEWAFPSGYVDFGETWQEAAVRENQEEMNVLSTIKDYEFFDIKKPSNGNMLVFCTSKFTISDEKLIKDFETNEEVIALDVYYGKPEYVLDKMNRSGHPLAFPTHIECSELYLERLNGDGRTIL